MKNKITGEEKHYQKLNLRLHRETHLRWQTTNYLHKLDVLPLVSLSLPSLFLSWQCWGESLSVSPLFPCNWQLHQPFHRINFSQLYSHLSSFWTKWYTFQEQRWLARRKTILGWTLNRCWMDLSSAILSRSVPPSKNSFKFIAHPSPNLHLSCSVRKYLMVN